MTPNQFRRALLQVRFELDRLGKSLQRLATCEYPTEIASGLIEEQQDLVYQANESLKSIEADYADDPPGASARLSSENRKLMQKRQYLEVLEQARSDEVPWSLVPSIERLAKTILDGRSALITTTSDMNYMVSWSLQETNEPITIYLPKLHRSNAFLHVLIGHEIFHPLVDEFIPIEKQQVTPLLLAKCKQLIQSESGQPDLFASRRLDNLLGYALDQWERALCELMCDMGAAALFGPAALWSISGYAALFDLDAEPIPENQFYPPWRLRLKTVLDYLVKVDHCENIVKELSELLESEGLDYHSKALQSGIENEKTTIAESAMPKVSSNRLTSQVYECVNSSLERASAFVADKAARMKNRWTKTWQEVPHLLQRLALLVPPSEILDPTKSTSSAASLTAIVSACWIERAKLEHYNEINLADYQRLCRLMLKAIEDSELKRDFERWGK